MGRSELNTTLIMKFYSNDQATCDECGRFTELVEEVPKSDFASPRITNEIKTEESSIEKSSIEDSSMEDSDIQTEELKRMISRLPRVCAAIFEHTSGDMFRMMGQILFEYHLRKLITGLGFDSRLADSGCIEDERLRPFVKNLRSKTDSMLNGWFAKYFESQQYVSYDDEE